MPLERPAAQRRILLLDRRSNQPPMHRSDLPAPWRQASDLALRAGERKVIYGNILKPWKSPLAKVRSFIFLATIMFGPPHVSPAEIEKSETEK